MYHCSESVIIYYYWYYNDIMVTMNSGYLLCCSVWESLFKIQSILFVVMLGVGHIVFFMYVWSCQCHIAVGYGHFGRLHLEYLLLLCGIDYLSSSGCCGDLFISQARPSLVRLVS